MDDTFQIKVHAAAVAAWQAVVIAALFFVVQWLLFLGVMATQPAWVVPFWGPGATWESIHTVWFQALVYLKISLWLLVLAALWLTLWARQLRRSSRA